MGWGERQKARIASEHSSVVRERNLAWGEIHLLRHENEQLRAGLAAAESRLADLLEERSTALVEERDEYNDHVQGYNDLVAEVNRLGIKLGYAQGLANTRGRIIEQIRDHFGLEDAELQAILDCKDEHHV